MAARILGTLILFSFYSPPTLSLLRFFSFGSIRKKNKIVNFVDKKKTEQLLVLIWTVRLLAMPILRFVWQGDWGVS